MKLLHLDRARGRRRGPWQPAPLPYQTVGFANVTRPILGLEGARPRMGRVISAQRTDGVKQGRGEGPRLRPSIAVHCNNREFGVFTAIYPARHVKRLDKNATQA